MRTITFMATVRIVVEVPEGEVDGLLSARLGDAFVSEAQLEDCNVGGELLPCVEVGCGCGELYEQPSPLSDVLEPLVDAFLEVLWSSTAGTAGKVGGSDEHLLG